MVKDFWNTDLDNWRNLWNFNLGAIFEMLNGDDGGWGSRSRSFGNADETGPPERWWLRIFFVCVDGFAKAKMDGDGFYLRLKTATENLFCFKFWNTDWDNLGNFWNFLMWITEAEVLEAVVVGTRMKRVRLAERWWNGFSLFALKGSLKRRWMVADFLCDWKLRLNTYLASSFGTRIGIIWEIFEIF